MHGKNLKATISTWMHLPFKIKKKKDDLYTSYKKREPPKGRTREILSLCLKITLCQEATCMVFLDEDQAKINL